MDNDVPSAMNKSLLEKSMWDWETIDSVAIRKETIRINMIHLGTSILGGGKYREQGEMDWEGPTIHV